jgi:hypothetical protein
MLASNLFWSSIFYREGDGNYSCGSHDGYSREQAELSCQMFPPQSAEYMEVLWFRGDHSQPIYLYRGGHEVNGEAAPEYVNHIEFVKEVIGEGKVTLRTHNISISDDRPYQCSLNDSSFSDVASMNLSVAGKCACQVYPCNALVTQ